MQRRHGEPHLRAEPTDQGCGCTFENDHLVAERARRCCHFETDEPSTDDGDPQASRNQP